MTDWSYDAWPTGEPYDWKEAGQGHRPDDQLDFHVDLGCGKLKKGRIGIDRFPAPGVNIVADLDRGLLYAVAPDVGRDAVEILHDTTGPLTRLHNGDDSDGYGGGYYDYLPRSEWRNLNDACQPDYFLPFADSSIDSMISHHALEHIGPGFVGLMDECYRVLKPGAIFRIIVPLFPSTSAVEDPDHKRWFLDGTFDAFCGFPDHIWCESFAVPYTKARFECTDKDMTALLPPERRWTAEDRREIRVTLRPRK